MQFNTRNVAEDNSFTTRSSVETNHIYDQIGSATERPEYTELEKDNVGQANAYDDLKPIEVNGEYENTVNASISNTIELHTTVMLVHGQQVKIVSQYYDIFKGIRLGFQHCSVRFKNSVQVSGKI
ncbi:hypothetical protein MAR_021055 [Mya arenaria]|uniref:Uncharacterized protein n=1 Tax=Mya arenaria TaxID=6604 RepID=A0ABY7EAL4_MYAAR|nr:hypothetical protein MAR_021055 [Mya arenaria]